MLLAVTAEAIFSTFTWSENRRAGHSGLALLPIARDFQRLLSRQRGRESTLSEWSDCCRQIRGCPL